jgi:hypothetical protein
VVQERRLLVDEMLLLGSRAARAAVLRVTPHKHVVVGTPTQPTLVTSRRRFLRVRVSVVLELEAAIDTQL